MGELAARLVCGEEVMVLPARGQGLPAARRRLFVEDTQIRKFRFVGGALRWPECHLPAHLTSSVNVGVAVLDLCIGTLIFWRASKPQVCSAQVSRSELRVGWFQHPSQRFR